MWKIYYSDDTSITSYDATPYSLKKRNGIQVIVQDTHPEVGWHTVCGDHFYVWDNRGSGFSWWGVDNFGLYDYLLQSGHKYVLFGESIDNTKFREIFNRAKEDMELFGKEKVGFTRSEVQP